ncbi:sensor histidine kinase [Saccharopolyspora sp. K220]|uniref:sensor histidine kinase n=1 Tax=Saccharopolyspora soli TaxID=2926618 RepID=UPI001F58E0FB|nr:sensor histidine kinase [Saccharopolyspora soli]MCI2423729.1 sensor histidine kinase [Saccharopolyspora soli]
MIGAVGSWKRKHPHVIDAALAAVVFVYNLPVQGAYVPGGLPASTGVLVSIGLCAPYVVRRDFPLATFGATIAAFAVQLTLGMGFLPADVMLVFALYNVAVCCQRRVSIAAAGAVALCVLLVAAGWGSELFLTVIDLVTALVLIVSVWLWGSTIGIRRAYVASLQERAVQLEKERDSQARIATAKERARIAREIHDIVSHSLSVVVVLAEGAALSVRSDPDRAEQQLKIVEGTGRSALAEMRRMLDVLRDGEPGSHAPQPGVAQLEKLVADARASGSPVEFAVHGTPQELPAGTDLAVYRIVQEALTNTRKHAGPDVTRVDVQLCFSDQDLEVRVRDDGRGPAADDASGGGHGLVGMRERVAAYGGALRTWPRADGGFEVVATLPLGRTA